MRAGKNAVFLLLGVLVGVLACNSTAHAEDPRDYMFSRPPDGNFFTLDYFGSGAQLSLEHREDIYGGANNATFGVNTLLGYPLAQGTAYARLRVLFLEFGTTLGYETLWRNLSFAPGKNGEYCSACDRGARRARDPILSGGPDTQNIPWAEAKVDLYAPLNDHVVFTALMAARYDDARTRTYDWFFASVHDGGVEGRFESQLFFHHRRWGGIAPYVQAMFLPRSGQHDTEVAWGFNAVARLGLVDRGDLLFFTFLIRPGDRYYGQHDYYAPVRALLVYRVTLSL